MEPLMNTEPFGPELTAFALNDPSLIGAQKHAIEARLAAEPAARQFVEETRSLGCLLTEGMAVNVELAEDSPMARTVAATLQKKPKRGMLPWWVAAVAACVAFAIGIGVSQRNPTVVAKLGEKRSSSAAPMREDLSREDQGIDSKLESTIDTNSRRFGNTASMTPLDINEDPGPSAKTVQDAIRAHSVPEPTVTWGDSPQAEGVGMQTGNGGQAGVGLPGTMFKGRSSSTRQKLTAAYGGNSSPDYEPSGSRNAFHQLVENPFTEVKGEAALSTFGVDVDTASYSLVRNYLNHNTLPPKDAVRLEEMVNYFPYKDAPPEGNDPFAVRVEMGECPWQPKHKLARIALKAKPIDNSKRPKSNLVFLIDVSGSMDGPNRLPLVKAAMKLLLGQLGENDRVALVVYAGASGLVLDSTNCGNKDTILKALDDLKPGGSTNGASGIQLAYDIAVNNFIKDGTNRVILCTDGDWNVGTTSTDALIKLIEEKRKTGVFLSVFGFGMGNLRDEMMVQLAGKGNGNYAYIDTIAEAKKALVEQVSGTLVTVAKDVKIQIEFNPARVASYRLLGYEKRILAAKDFHDDKKDAGEMGAGHVVTALYELVPAGVVAEPKVDGLRYQPKVEAPKAPAADDKLAQEAFVLKLRHKMPQKDESVLREIPVKDEARAKDKVSDDFQFASAVAAFALVLKDSPYKAGANFGLVEELAGASLTNDPGAYRAEFLALVKKAKALSGK
jgi:Ca-activated chloride channel family protein